MGSYDDMYVGAYPIYLSAFNPTTGLLLSQVTFNFNADNNSFTNSSSPLCVGINKTGYLSIQDFYEAAFVPYDSGVDSIVADDAYITGYYDLQGRRLDKAPADGGIYIVKYSDGTTQKVMRR